LATGFFCNPEAKRGGPMATGSLRAHRPEMYLFGSDPSLRSGLQKKLVAKGFKEGQE